MCDFYLSPVGRGRPRSGRVRGMERFRKISRQLRARQTSDGAIRCAIAPYDLLRRISSRAQLAGRRLDGLSLSGQQSSDANAPRERDRICIRPRDSGGGGPPEGWWRGRLTQSFVVVEGGYLLCRAAVRHRAARAPSTAQTRGPPSPLSRGRKNQCTTIVVLPLPWRSTRPNRMAALPGSSRTQPCETGRPRPEIS